MFLTKRKQFHFLLFVATLMICVIGFSTFLQEKAYAVGYQIYSGDSMFETAVDEAQAAYPQGSSSAILVGTGEAWIDGLSAAGLAATKGPILYTWKSSLQESTAGALRAMGVESVIIVGGLAAISPAVEADLAARGIAVEARLAGETCYETQVAIYEYGVAQGCWGKQMAIVATASHFGDALSVSPVAYAQRAPIFLTDNTGALNDTQKSALIEASRAGSFSRVVAVGGTSVISEMTMGFLDFISALASGSGECVRLAGSDQYETSSAVAQWAVKQKILAWNGVAFTSGALPWDALAGSVLQGKTHSVLLLVGDASSPTIDIAARNRGSIDFVRFFGGDSAVPASLKLYVRYSVGYGYALPMGPTTLSNGSYLWCNSSGVDRQEAIDAVMNLARSCLGIPYVWLGKYPEDGGMDCASFTWHLYTRNLGMEIGYETYDQMNAGIRVNSLAEALPGDLILMYYGARPNFNIFLPEHVVLYAGNGMIYEEPTFGGRCQYVPLSSKNPGKIEIRRIVF